MADILPFKHPRARKEPEKLMLCRSGFHKWEVEKAKRFDVKQGRLVTSYRCRRCGAVRNEAR